MLTSFASCKRTADGFLYKEEPNNFAITINRDMHKINNITNAINLISWYDPNNICIDTANKKKLVINTKNMEFAYKVPEGAALYTFKNNKSITITASKIDGKFYINNMLQVYPDKDVAINIYKQQYNIKNKYRAYCIQRFTKDIDDPRYNKSLGYIDKTGFLSSYEDIDMGLIYTLSLPMKSHNNNHILSRKEDNYVLKYLPLLNTSEGIVTSEHNRRYMAKYFFNSEFEIFIYDETEFNDFKERNL